MPSYGGWSQDRAPRIAMSYFRRERVMFLLKNTGNSICCGETPGRIAGSGDENLGSTRLNFVAMTDDRATF
jgi:hypothetical protein